MTWTAPRTERTTSLSTLGMLPERQLLEGWLNWHRETLLAKCAGLDAVRLATAAVEPSNLTLAERDFGRYRAEITACDAAVAGRALDETFMSTPDAGLSLRAVYVLMIQEYARHNGHADLLRERTDGVTGD